ncbi:DUF1361 domain-containing protein [Leptolyngbya sp. FACHB-261]|uniref:DUF1361 domain-containing protein n=1 Tax=Leptolyngbya sp. FACHB-261 TaxID=2692806 RepID=UPI0016875884|nr:DUF1361 domain-containing protein [Leptolyngbya sp. FACHB-261]MBD2104938.1 DUF1361 domain-containing protein [Leptolyngbya sp. FACHB-261]
MAARMVAFCRYIWEVLHPDFGLGWNLFLALIPLGLSLLLFRGKARGQGGRRGTLWWLTAIAFLLFLPNAAYVLTDVIHLITEIRREPPLPLWTIVLILIPQYALFILAGFQAHVLSLLNLGHYLQKQRRPSWVLPMESGLNLLCAMGIYLGRFRRFNSWDIATQPEELLYTTLNDFTSRFPLAVVTVTFVVITGLYYLFKGVDLAVLEAWQRRHIKPEPPAKN